MVKNTFYVDRSTYFFDCTDGQVETKPWAIRLDISSKEHFEHLVVQLRRYSDAVVLQDKKMLTKRARFM